MMEILMTLLLLTVVLMGLAALQISTIRQVSLARRANGALRLGQIVVERFQAQEFAQLSAVASPDWEPVFKRDMITPMTGVSENGEGTGPYTVQQLIEIPTNGDRLITVRVSWLDVMPGSDPLPTEQYRTLDVLLTLRRTDS